MTTIAVHLRSTAANTTADTNLILWLQGSCGAGDLAVRLREPTQSLLRLTDDCDRTLRSFPSKRTFRAQRRGLSRLAAPGGVLTEVSSADGVRAMRSPTRGASKRWIRIMA